MEQRIRAHSVQALWEYDTLSYLSLFISFSFVPLMTSLTSYQVRAWHRKGSGRKAQGERTAL